MPKTAKKKIPPYTPKQFAAMMRKIADNDIDKESRHGDANDLLCEQLELLGYREGVSVYKKMEKWYA